MSGPMVNARRAGYFRKVVAILIQKRFVSLATYLTGKPAVITSLVNAIANTSILEVKTTF
jgi:hypothetical protein